MDNDSRMYSVAGMLTRDNGDTISLTVRRVELNRDGGPHLVSQVPRDLDNVELRLAHAFSMGRLSAAIGQGDPGTGSGRSSGLNAFVIWQQGF